MKINNIAKYQSIFHQLGQKSRIGEKLLYLSINTGLALGSISVLISSTAHKAVAQKEPINDGLLEQIERYSNPEKDDALGQVTNINQLRDVSPADWSYEALRSLVDRYGCISGFPNQTYRGNRALSRYEFAAGLNSCLNQIERLIASNGSLSPEELATIERLNEEFSSEIAALGGRIDNVEELTAVIEDQQFSATTKLAGEVVFSLGEIFTGDNAAGEEIDSETVFGNRARLSFNTSFTGKDLLYTQFTAGNFPFFGETTGTFEGDLGLIADNGNDLSALVALYAFPISDRTTVFLEGFGGIAFDFADTISPLDHFNDSASGAISAFGQRNPIYNQVFGSGIGIKSELSDSFEVSAGYLAPNAADPSDGNGLFDGSYSALGQLVFKPGDRLKLGLTYVNSFNGSDNFSGSNLSNLDSFIQGITGVTAPISSNSYGVEASFNLSDHIILAGWGGYTKNTVREAVDANGTTISEGDQDVWNWAVTMALPDLLKEGNLGGIVFGMEPRVTDSDIDIAGVVNTDPDTSFHIEAFYQYQLNDNIAITPGAVYITAPDHNSNNDGILIGTLRTTFTF